MPTPGIGASQRASRLQQTAGMAAAVLLPWAFISLSIHSSLLSSTPLALSFAAIAAITLFSGFRAGLLTSVVTTLVLNHTLFTDNSFFATDTRSLLRSAIIFAVGLLITAVFHRQRIIGSRLSVTLASLQARTDALSEAQQGGNSVAWTMNLAGKTLEWAEGGSPIFGRPFSELSSIDDAIRLIFEEDRLALAHSAENAMSTNQPFDCEFRVAWPDGGIHWIASHGSPSPLQPKLWRGVSIDVTDRKRAELALLRAEKLTAVGRLSATVAHEINNPLEAVTNLLYLATSDPTLSATTRGYLEQAEREVARLASIARHTLTFAHPRGADRPSHISEVLEGVTRMFQPKCYARSAALRILPDDSLVVSIPQDDLRQVLTNLLSNACDALPSAGGIVEIEMIRQENSALILVRDNGSGIAAKDAERIFEPFFTTKVDIGTGIGLWVSRELVHKSGGHISLQIHELPPGFHTMFRVELPLAREDHPSANPIAQIAERTEVAPLETP
jgi:signal transduction histidine kinase